MGAEFIVTQMFFNVEKYKEFVNKCRENDIHIPIIPGLKPLTTKKQLITLPKIFHLDIPEELSEAVSGCKNNADVRQVGEEWLVQQCKELIDFGAPVLHFYTMSNPGPTKSIVEKLF
ncbi:5,10-methylenetetrahydrofolate reductase [compost metagenome]